MGQEVWGKLCRSKQEIERAVVVYHGRAEAQLLVESFPLRVIEFPDEL